MASVSMTLSDRVPSRSYGAKGDGGLNEGACRIHRSTLRTLSYAGTGFAVGTMIGGALSFSVLPRVIIPVTASHAVGVVLCSVACSIVSALVVRALKGVLWEGPALREAVRAGRSEEVKRLCKDGVWVDLADEEGERALGCAIAMRRVEMVRELLGYGADIVGVDKGGRTPLMLAARYGCPEIAKMLIAEGADVNAFNDCHETPLWLAMDNRWLAMDNCYEEIVMELLKSGADIGLTDRLGRTIRKKSSPLLMVAAVRGRVELVGELCRLGSAVNVVDAYTGFTPLMGAIGSNREEVVEKLIELGADVDYIGDDRVGRPLMFAVQVGHTNIVRKLLDSNADIDRFAMVGKRRYTAVMYATKHGRTEVVALLIEKGANLCLTDDEGRNVLAHAVGEGCLEIVKQLCKTDGKDGFIDSTDCDGRTPLMCAVDTDDAEIAIVEKLLESGANVNEPDCVGRTPLIAATERGRSDIVKRLLKKKTLVIDRFDRDGWTALMFAVKRGDLDIVRELLKHKADPNRHDHHEGVTPLIIAAQLGREDIVEELIRCGADPLHTDGTNRTACDWASKKQHRRTIVLLQQARETWEKKGKKSCDTTPV